MNARVLLIEARRHFETATRLRPGHPRYLELLGAACFVSGDTLTAIQHYEQALLRGRSARLVWMLAWAYVHAGRLADVERLVRELIEEGRGCPRALYVRSLARFRRKAFDPAIEDLREAMPDEVDVPFFRIELARLLIAAALAMGSPASALTASGLVLSPRTRMLREAADLLRAGHIDDPGSVKERNYLTGCVYLELGEPTRALSVLAETDYPSHAEASFRRALAAARDGDTQTATNCFEEAADGSELEAAASAGITALASTGHLDRLSVPKPVIVPHGLGPPSAPAIVRLLIRGEGFPSVPEVAASSPPSPRSPGHPGPNAEEALGKLTAALERDDVDFAAASDCVAVLEDGARLEPGIRQRLLHALATVLDVDLKTPVDDVERALPLLERLRRADPELAFPRLYLARALYRCADYERAIDELTGLEGPLRSHVVVHNVLGRCHEKLGHVFEAQRSYEDSLARRTEQPTIQFALGRILLNRYRETCEAPFT
jgi:tetratricopeptide (TPR) repeat protein